MCLLSLATVGLSSVLSILKLLYLSVQEGPSSQLRSESFELWGSEDTRSQKIKETISFKEKKKKDGFKRRGQEKAPLSNWLLFQLKLGDRLNHWPPQAPAPFRDRTRGYKTSYKKRRRHPHTQSSLGE